MGHCLFLDTLDELQSNWSVGHVVLSQLAVFTKLKPDGSAKHRPILDLLRPDVSSTVAFSERIELPGL